MKIDEEKSVKNYFNEISSFGLKNVIDVPTRVTNLGGSLIDHFYCSNPQKVLNSCVLLSDISDHFPLYIKLKQYCSNKANINNKNQYYHDYSKINLNKLLTDTSTVLNKFQIYKIINSNNTIHSKFECLIDKIKKIINKNFTMKKLSKSKLKLKLKPWITKGILKSIRYKNRLYKKLCKNNFKDKLKLQEYKTYRNKLTKIKTISKKMYYGKKLKNSNKNSSETWKVINDITKRKKKDNDFPHILKVNEKSVNNPIDIVNNLILGKQPV